MKKFFMALMSVALLAGMSSCDKENDEKENNQQEQQPAASVATQVSCDFTLNISNDMLTYSDIVVEYYDKATQTKKQATMTSKQWNYSVENAALPVDLTMKVSGTLKDNFDVNTIDTFSVDYTATYSYKVKDANGKVLKQLNNNRSGKAGFSRNRTGNFYIDKVVEYYNNRGTKFVEFILNFDDKGEIIYPEE